MSLECDVPKYSVGAVAPAVRVPPMKKARQGRRRAQDVHNTHDKCKRLFLEIRLLKNSNWSARITRLARMNFSYRLGT